MIVKFIDCKSDDFSLVRDIRASVFTREQGLIADEEFDCFDSDMQTVYALVFDNDAAVATGRIAKTDKGFKIGRIAVEASQRGRGTGAFLVNCLCEKATQMGAAQIFVDSQPHAVGFYERLGFIATGESEIIDRGLPHLPMKKG